MKTIYYQSFQKSKATREGNDVSSENFDMAVLSEGALDKDLMVPKKETDIKQPWKTKYEVVDEE